jgi:gluconolactonase
LWIGGRLLFADIPSNIILQLDPTGNVKAFRSPSNNANGLAVDAQGRLIVCENGSHRLTRTLTDGSTVTIASNLDGRRFNGPNDVIVRSDGTIYFTDPDGEADPADRQPFQGVFRVDSGGSLSVLSREMREPNGIAFSPDEKTLYVVDWGTSQILMMGINADGTAGAAAEFTKTGERPDGMTVDHDGNVYVATGVGVQVFGPDGVLRGVIALPEQPSNCAFGGADGRTLYITARTSLYSVRVGVAGPP